MCRPASTGFANAVSRSCWRQKETLTSSRWVYILAHFLNFSLIELFLPRLSYLSISTANQAITNTKEELAGLPDLRTQYMCYPPLALRRLSNRRADRGYRGDMFEEVHWYLQDKRKMGWHDKYNIVGSLENRFRAMLQFAGNLIRCKGNTVM